MSFSMVSNENENGTRDGCPVRWVGDLKRIRKTRHIVIFHVRVNRPPASAYNWLFQHLHWVPFFNDYSCLRIYGM